MAAGVVSGVVADLLQKSPSLTPDQVKARLMKTAWKSLPAYSSTTDPTTGITYTDQYDVFTVGAGYVDVEAALNNTDVARGTAMSPIATFNGNTNSVSPKCQPVLGLEHFLHMVVRHRVGKITIPYRHIFRPRSRLPAQIPAAALSGEATPCGVRTPCGAPTRCGVRMRCGEATPCGVRMPCGEVTPCGAPTPLPANNKLGQFK